jgi:hypothetical protein
MRICEPMSCAAGLILRPTPIFRPISPAILARRSISPKDSTLSAKMPSWTTLLSSSSVLPGPAKTMSSGSNPAARATASSPEEATSAPASFSRAMSWHTPRLGFAFTE